MLIDPVESWKGNKFQLAGPLENIIISRPWGGGREREVGREGGVGPTGITFVDKLSRTMNKQASGSPSGPISSSAATPAPSAARATQSLTKEVWEARRLAGQKEHHLGCPGIRLVTALKVVVATTVPRGALLRLLMKKKRVDKVGELNRS